MWSPSFAEEPSGPGSALACAWPASHVVERLRAAKGLSYLGEEAVQMGFFDAFRAKRKGMEEPFDLLTCAAAGRRENPQCSRCKVGGLERGERFDTELALVKRDYVCPRCGVQWTESE